MAQVFQQIWKASVEVGEMDESKKLLNLTKELIDIYDLQGRLSEDPLKPSKERILSLPVDKVSDLIFDQSCLVTGGLGCVGGTLVRELLRFRPKQIIIVDSRYGVLEGLSDAPYSEIIYVHGDIRDKSFIGDVFEHYSPTIVFHTAAQRNPGLAEKQIGETLKTNILGTWNVLNCCGLSNSVRRVVFSSTGKASRYYTEEVYAASKKVCEMLMDYFAHIYSDKFFSMVRFTHIVDNSLMDEELRDAAQNKNRVCIHSPGKFVTAQNVREAAYLMLNALLYGSSRKCPFLLVKNLEWPVESLEMALYYIKKYGRDIPVVFTGNPLGYGEKFFRGQLDWSQSRSLNLLINVYENRIKQTNEDNDILISSIMPYDEYVLLDLVQQLNGSETDEFYKNVLVEAMRKIFAYSLDHVDKKVTVEILKWGIDPKFLDADNLKVEDFGELIPMMLESLKGESDLGELPGFFEIRSEASELK